LAMSFSDSGGLSLGSYPPESEDGPRTAKKGVK